MSRKPLKSRAKPRATQRLIDADRKRVAPQTSARSHGKLRTRAMRPSSFGSYHPKEGVDSYVRRVGRADPLQLIELERTGVQSSFAKDLSTRLNLPQGRFFEMLGIPKATVERKVAAGKKLSGSGGFAVIAMTKLIHLAEGIIGASTADEARAFDAATWLGEWIERPQPSLGGRRPAELLDTPTGFNVVARLLGALESGSFQ